MMAEAICFECVVAAARARGRPQPSQPHQEQRQAPPPQRPGPKREEIEAALKTIGLDTTATWEEVESAYKKLLVRYHPDRKRTEVGKEKAEAKFKKVRSAYDTLKAMHERRAAA